MGQRFSQSTNTDDVIEKLRFQGFNEYLFEDIIKDSLHKMGCNNGEVPIDSLLNYGYARLLAWLKSNEPKVYASLGKYMWKIFQEKYRPQMLAAMNESKPGKNIKKITESQLRSIIRKVINEEIGNNNDYILYSISSKSIKNYDSSMAIKNDEHRLPQYKGKGIFLARKSDAMAIAKTGKYGSIINTISAPMDLVYDEEDNRNGLYILVPYTEYDKLHVVGHIDMNQQSNKEKKAAPDINNIPSLVKNIITMAINKNMIDCESTGNEDNSGNYMYSYFVDVYDNSLELIYDLGEFAEYFTNDMKQQAMASIDPLVARIVINGKEDSVEHWAKLHPNMLYASLQQLKQYVLQSEAWAEDYND